ncbi:hypothetical protein AN640_07115 [Candidatus Epulonipiscium fishelsonii]|uniref:Uncharacterized protein n=1 Tax=Candidatus Epulonipiscium fishelsonii TaxID=77094 RepID=A0ACC8XGP5_9FIRM|nr:hypothetical protein AN640_07115 [Epulopiscium sp. SCG-D08WGA-EpuloA1]
MKLIKTIGDFKPMQVSMQKISHSLKDLLKNTTMSANEKLVMVLWKLLHLQSILLNMLWNKLL